MQLYSSETLQTSSLRADMVISCLPSNALSRILSNSPRSSSLLSEIPFVDVGVVNLGYSSPVLPVKGFGYLVPRTQDSSVLGCIFDSVTLPNVHNMNQDRMTVMMGGSSFSELFGDANKVDPNLLLRVAQKSLARHLGIRANPTASHVTVAKSCIPQYLVGHHARLERLHDALKAETQGALVAGCSFGGVGINDVLLNARSVANAAVESILGNSIGVGPTGLESIVGGTK